MLFAIQELFDSHTYFIMGIVVAITLYITFTETSTPHNNIFVILDTSLFNSIPLKLYYDIDTTFSKKSLNSIHPSFM